MHVHRYKLEGAPRLRCLVHAIPDMPGACWPTKCALRQLCMQCTAQCRTYNSGTEMCDVATSGPCAGGEGACNGNGQCVVRL